jgi:hypothetical protein
VALLFRPKILSLRNGWYFLDFNQGAVDEQLAHHWDGLNGVPIDYTSCDRMLRLKRVSCIWIASPAGTRGSFRP